MPRPQPPLPPLPASLWESEEHFSAYAAACFKALGLEQWRFGFVSGLNRTKGKCKHEGIIHINGPWARKQWTKSESAREEILTTLFNELAHAITPLSEPTHGKVWRHNARALGNDTARAPLPEDAPSYDDTLTVKLFEACERGNWPQVCQLITQGADAHTSTA